jgi:beta-N-acetylhexosaminidase
MLDLLRKQMGFQGILVTDALDMNGVLGKATMGEVTQQAVAAGNDVLLMPTDVNAAIEAWCPACASGAFTEARVDSSVRRLLVAKHRWDSIVTGSWTSRRFAASLRTAPTLRRRVSRPNGRSRSLRDSLGMIPLGRLPRTSRVVSLTIAPRAELSAGATFNAELQRQFPAAAHASDDAEIVFDATAGAASGGTGATSQSRSSAASGNRRQRASRCGRSRRRYRVIVLRRQLEHCDHGCDGRSSRTDRRITESWTQVILVSFANPYLAQGLPATPVFLEAWSGSPLSQRAAARALLGLAPITGQLPITIRQSLRMAPDCGATLYQDSRPDCRASLSQYF